MTADEPLRWQDSDGEIYLFRWLGQSEQAPSRVYALAFNEHDELMLVASRKRDDHWWVPGGGVEASETALEALRRELWEEIGATITTVPQRLGVQQVEHVGHDVSAHAYYYCRVSLAPAGWPEEDMLQRRGFGVERFLDALFWGRFDPTAARLLELAVSHHQPA